MGLALRSQRPLTASGAARFGAPPLSKVGTTFTPEWYQPRSALLAACIGSFSCKHVRMADPDVRWLQRLEKYGNALGMLQRALEIATAGAQSELEELGLIQTFKSTHELKGERHQRIQRCGA